MASLCTKCLAELQQGSPTCPHCGAVQGSTPMFGEKGLLNSVGQAGSGLPGNGLAGNDLAGNGDGTMNGGGNGFASGGGLGSGPGIPSGMPPGTMAQRTVPGAVLPQIVLPPVVPPIPGAENLGAAGEATAEASDENASFALKWEPPPFERTIDPASPQSLLGPSSHRAPGSTAPAKPAAAPHALAPTAAPTPAPPAVAPAATIPPAAPTPAPPAVARAATIPPATIPVQPRQASGPTPQELLFGTPQPASEVPLSELHPATAEPETAEPETAPVAPAMTHSHTARNRGLRKLLKQQKAMIPIAVLVIAGAMVASVMATASTKPPAKAVTKTSTVGTHPSTKPLSHGTPPRAATGKTLVVALRSPADDARPDVTVRVGNDGPIHVVLDTGSVGLRVFSNLVPTGINKGIHITGPQDSIEYVDGTQFSGPVAQALVHIGKLTTTTTVPFQLVQSVTCDPTIPDCPASGGASQFEADGVDGIMGIGLTGPYQGDPTTNPLLSLPAPYRNSWSIAMQGGGRTLPAPGTLILGAHNPTAPAADFALQQEGASVHGLPTWNDQFNLCWNVGGISSCELSVFDSGSDLTVLGGTQFASVPTNDPGQIGTLTTGTAVQASQEVDSNPLWSFTSGGGAMQTVIVEPDGMNWVNSGVQAFYSFTVTYNEASGTILLS